MSGFGSDPFVERVREANDIVELIGEVVPLKKAGSRFTGRCPFHQEKTPSFSVNPSMQAYHCFGCGVGGDIFSFVMAHEKLSFPKAVRFLAERKGIAVPTQRGPASDKLEKLREALRLARTFYRSQLEGGPGAAARAYLDRRGIRAETRERYGLGFAPDRWDGLLQHARALVSDRILIEAGLAAESEGGRVYDRFRNRVIVPIESAAGLPVGFGGRILGEGEPKYMNSPETVVYRKGSLLFGTAPAREGIRAAGRVIVVEGYFDVIALMQAGIPGVIGTCGTALTPEQATILKRLSDRVVVVFDGDEAGLRAALRALPILVGVVPEVRVARPPEGKDPDLWVREQGPEAVAQAFAEAPGPLAFLEALMAAGRLPRREAARRAAELAAGIADPLDRDLWTQEGASRFGITLEAFAEGVRKLAGGRPAPPARSSAASETRAQAGRPRWTGLERQCLRSALAHPEGAAEIASAVADARVFEPELVALLQAMAAAADEGGGSPSVLSRVLREHPRAAELAEIAAEAEGPAWRPETLAATIRERGIRQRLSEVNQSVARAASLGNREEAERLQQEGLRLASELERLDAIKKGRADSAGPDPGPPF